MSRTPHVAPDLNCAVEWLGLDVIVLSLVRYLNHGRGREANLILHRPLMVSGLPKVAFLASRDIKAGEELLWDYGADPRYSPHWMKGKKVAKPQAGPSDSMVSLVELYSGILQ